MIPNVCPWFFWMFDKSWHLASSQSLQNAVPQFQVHCVTECCCTLFHACWLKIVLYKANQSHLHYDSNSNILRNRPKKAAYQFWLMKMCPNTPQSSSKKIVFDSKNRPLLGRQLQAFRWARATLLSHLLRKIGMEASDTEGWMEFSSKVGRLGHLSHGFREIRKTLDPLHHQSENLKCRMLFLTHHARCILNGICCSMKFHLQSYSWINLEEVLETLWDVKMLWPSMDDACLLVGWGFKDFKRLEPWEKLFPYKWVHDLHPAVDSTKTKTLRAAVVGHFNKLLTIEVHGSYQYI